MVEFGPPSLMAVLVKDKRLLVLKYSNFYNLPEVNQKYVLPGGTPNENKTLTSELIREVNEETGLDVKVLEPTHLDLFINKANGKVRPIGFYNCQVIEDRPIKLSEEHEEYEWVSLEKAKTLDWVDKCFIRFLDKLSIE